MALGEMYRSKGEIGRAVRIQQNLLARLDLSQSFHLDSHLALALDFQTGGLLDRALMQYQKALDMRSDHAGALEASLRIREQSSEWLQAEELLSRLERVRNASYSSHRAYLFSEMASQCCREVQREAAAEYAAKALELDTACAPARMVEIELALQADDFDAAEAGIRALREYSREHFPLVVSLLVGYENFYKERGIDLLKGFCQQERDAELVLAWLESVADRFSRQQAVELCDELAFVPGTLRESLRLQAMIGDESDPHAQFSRQWRIIAKNYGCEECGVEVVEVRWQCPQCHAWGTLHPKQKETV